MHLESLGTGMRKVRVDASICFETVNNDILPVQNSTVLAALFYTVPAPGLMRRAPTRCVFVHEGMVRVVDLRCRSGMYGLTTVIFYIYSEEAICSPV
jgi:hypothetical protein